MFTIGELPSTGSAPMECLAFSAGAGETEGGRTLVGATQTRGKLASIMESGVGGRLGPGVTETARGRQIARDPEIFLWRRNSHDFRVICSP